MPDWPFAYTPFAWYVTSPLNAARFVEAAFNFHCQDTRFPECRSRFGRLFVLWESPGLEEELASFLREKLGTVAVFGDQKRAVEELVREAERSGTEKGGVLVLRRVDDPSVVALASCATWVSGRVMLVATMVTPPLGVLEDPSRHGLVLFAFPFDVDDWSGDIRAKRLYECAEIVSLG